MSTPTVSGTTEQSYGGFTALELGFLIGGVGVGILVIIALINVCICCCGADKKRKKHVKDEEKMVNMQTERALNGQSVKQVILKTQPNDEDVDSGTGTSPTRAAAAVDVHEDQPQAHENPAFDEEETPYASYSMPPPPPESMPPPLTPGTPVTDLDADETVIIPPPPPIEEDVYAQVDKNRGQSVVAPAQPEASTSISRSDSMIRSVWRPTSEIEIIEKAKF